MNWSLLGLCKLIGQTGQKQIRRSLRHEWLEQCARGLQRTKQRTWASILRGGAWHTGTANS